MHGTVERPCCPVSFSVWKIKMFNQTLNWSNLPRRFTRPKLEKLIRHSLRIHDWDHFPSLWEKISHLHTNIISIFLAIPTNVTKRDGSCSSKLQDRKDSDEIKWERCSQDYFRRHMEKIFTSIFWWVYHNKGRIQQFKLQSERKWINMGKSYQEFYKIVNILVLEMWFFMIE